MTFALVSTKPTDATAFLTLFNRLSVALHGQQDDSGVTQDVYFEALSDLPIQALQDGARALMTEPGRKWFPTTAEWRTASEKAQHAQLREAVQPARDQPWQNECDHCEDTGWTPHDCDGDKLCGRTKKHAAHSFVRICSCRPTNRTYMRHQHFGSGAA